jgi:ArsR family transcriptional regulator, arsenate/arsenite/antimonite-responsive transcriptional repressor
VTAASAPCIDRCRYTMAWSHRRSSMREDLLDGDGHRSRPTTAAACCAPLATPGLSKDQAADTAKLFKALADPHRVKIVNLLATSPEPVCVCKFTGPLGLSQPTVSHHLKKLVDAGLLEREQRGTWAYFSLNRDTLGRLAAAVDLQGAADDHPADRRRRRRPARAGPGPLRGRGHQGHQWPGRLWLRAVGRLRLRQRLLRSGGRRGARHRGRAVRPVGPRPAARHGPAGQPGLRQPDRGGRTPRGRDRPRPRLGWRHRRAVVGQAGRPHGQGLRAGHDRGDARPGPGQRRRGRRQQRGLPQGPHRGHPPPGGQRGRGHLQLRGQPLDRQAGSVRRDPPGPQAWRACRHHRRGGRGSALARGPGRAGVWGGLHRRRFVQGRVRGWADRGRLRRHLGGLHPPGRRRPALGHHQGRQASRRDLGRGHANRRPSRAPGGAAVGCC